MGGFTEGTSFTSVLEMLHNNMNSCKSHISKLDFVKDLKLILNVLDPNIFNKVDDLVKYSTENFKFPCLPIMNDDLKEFCNKNRRGYAVRNFTDELKLTVDFKPHFESTIIDTKFKYNDVAEKIKNSKKPATECSKLKMEFMQWDGFNIEPMQLSKIKSTLHGFREEWQKLNTAALESLRKGLKNRTKAHMNYKDALSHMEEARRLLLNGQNIDDGACESYTNIFLGRIAIQNVRNEFIDLWDHFSKIIQTIEKLKELRTSVLKTISELMSSKN